MRNRRFNFIAIIAGMSIFFSNSATGDTTYVSGIINTNTVWDTAGSPYVVVGDVLLNTGVRLDIRPGVEVLFTEDKYLMIKGILRSIGTEQDTIIFAALDTTRRWRRLWFKPEATACSLKYCRIAFAGSSAIYNEDMLTDTLYIGYNTITGNYGGGIFNSGTATITNNTITGNSGGGIENSGTATITNNTITGNSGGGIWNYYGTATITNNTITGNSAYYGGGIDNSGTATITNNTITGNSAEQGGGILNYATATITNNTITGNSADDEGGGILNYATATITNNTITGNSADYGGGIYNWGPATITGNTIIDSTRSTIYIVYIDGPVRLNYNNLNNLNPAGYTVYNATRDTINARNNYWFTLDTNVIKQKIYDFWDDFTLGEVFYRPFLTEPVPGVEEEIAFSRTKNERLAVYPNPAKSYLFIRLPQFPNRATLKIFDVSGKMVKELEGFGVQELRVPLKGINPGIYFLQLNNEPISEKLVITK